MSESALADVRPDGAIPRLDAAARAADDTAYAALRAYAVERAQAASGETWTDYNLHDPGLTFLEAICFALTDLVYQAEFPVADHLCGPDGEIDFKRQALFPPQTILPCRPTTPNDWRRIFLDRVTDLRDVRLRPSGLFGMFDLALSTQEAAETAQAHRAARAVFRDQRSLAEDLDRISEIQPVDCTLRLRGSIGGPRDPAEVVANIYDVCATALAPPVVAHSVESLLRQGRSLEEIFNGPSVLGGVIPDDAGPNERLPMLQGRLVLNELRARLLQDVDGLSAVTYLSLRRDNDPEQTRELTWKDGVEAMRLRTPQGRRDTAEEDKDIVDRIELTRSGGADVPLDPRDVADSYADRRAGRDDGRRSHAHGGAGLWAPGGAPRSPKPHVSLQNLLPPIYRLGVNRPPAEAGLLEAIADATAPHRDPPAADGAPLAVRAMPGSGPEEARVVQLKAYLALFDQIIANARTQIDHIRDLMTPAGVLARSYWRDVLGDDSVSQIQALYRGQTRDEVADKVYPKYDDVIERRSRALDFMLALYGEQYPQNTQRQFLGYLDSTEQARVLLVNKAEFLSRIDVLSRDRAAGFDYGEALWGEADLTPGFQRRMGLLLGFADARARPLATRETLGAPRTVARHQVDPRALHEPIPLAWPARHAEVWRGRATVSRTGARRPAGARGVPNEVWFALGLDRQNYTWRPIDGGGGALWLGRKAEGGHLIGVFETPHAAARAAHELRDHLLELTAACEGLHVVEHVLLRLRGGKGSPRSRGDHLRVTLVLPNWTARTRRADFRAFVQETAEINCPAHVSVDCLWLDTERLTEFESRYGRWMDELRSQCHSGAAPGPLDDAARAVRRFIRAARRRQRQAAGGRPEQRSNG